MSTTAKKTKKNNIGEIKISATTNRIENGAFLNRKDIITVEIDDNITVIGDSAFEGCENLRHIKLSADLQEIGKFAFYNCKNLKSISLSKKINRIGRSAFQNCTKLDAIEIFYGIDTIDAWTFAGCEDLKKVIIPNGVKYIGHQAFANCRRLETIETMSSQTSLGYEVFYCVDKKNCTIKVPQMCKNSYAQAEQWQEFSKINESDCFAVKGIRYKLKSQDAKTLIVTKNKNYAGVARIEDEVEFMGTKYTVTEIAEDAFKGNKELTYVHIPKNIENIGSGAFAYCENLKYFLSDTIVGEYFEIRDEVLYDKGQKTLLAYPAANERTVFAIPNTVTKIANLAFASFRYLERITFVNEVEFMGENVFDDANVEKCHAFIPKGAKGGQLKKNLGKWKFKDIKDSEYFIHEGINYKILSEEDSTVEVSDNRDYAGAVVIPDSIEYAGVTYKVVGVGERAFDENAKITSVKLPDSIKKVDHCAFQTLRIPMQLPLNLEVVGNYAFTYNQFTDLKLPNGLKVLNESSFGFTEVASKRAYIPDTVISISSNPFYASSLETIEVAPDNQNYKSVDGVLFSKDGGCILVYPSKKEGSSYTIPSGVKTIGCYWFAGNRNLQVLSIPKTVTQLEQWALWQCPNLRTIDIEATTPPSVLYRGLNGVSKNCIIKVPKGCVSTYKQAEGWKEFTSITDEIPQIRPHFKYEGINYSIIDFEKRTLEVQYNYKCTMKEVKIPATINLNGEIYTVEKIGQRAFFNNKDIERITLPNTIKHIDYKAFGSTRCIIDSIPPSVETIGAKAFYRINENNKFSIPNNIKEISPKAFLFSRLKDFTGLSGINFNVSSNVLVNKKDSKLICYPSAKEFKELQLPSEITKLGRHAFYCADNLTTITIPSTVNSIEFAFWGADKLQKLIVLSKQPPQFIGNKHLKKRCQILVPKGCVGKYKSHDDWKEFVNIKEIS